MSWNALTVAAVVMVLSPRESPRLAIERVDYVLLLLMLARTGVPGLHEPALGWEVLALGSTLAGNLTRVGSVANLSVFEAARGQAPSSFLGYLRVGLPILRVSFVLGLAVLLAEHAPF